jgi:hypothetical protein
VLDASLPVEPERWERGASLVRRIWDDDVGGPTDAAAARRSALLDELGRVMTEAHGLPPDDPVVGWWSMRLPRR